jgi:hypothetical protein
MLQRVRRPGGALGDDHDHERNDRHADGRAEPDAIETWTIGIEQTADNARRTARRQATCGRPSANSRHQPTKQARRARQAAESGETALTARRRRRQR